MKLNLARFSVNRPVAAGIISVALFLLGLFFVSKMPVSLYPEVSFPYVSVVVPLPGASAEQIEKKIVKPLEKEVASVKGVKRVIGHIQPGFGTVIVGFKMSTSEREAMDDVREKVAKLRSTFPNDTKEPIVSRIDLGATPVLIYGIAADGKDPAATKKLLDDTLVRELQRVDGVNEAEVVGLGDEQVQIDLDPAKLAALRVAPLDVYQQLSAFVAAVPWGDVRQDGHVLSVNRAALPSDPQYWADHEVTLADGRTVRLGELGTPRLSHDEDASKVHINGQPGLGLVVTKRADANTLDVVKRVKEVVADSRVKLFPIIDQSSYITENSHEVWIALFAGGAFAVLVILFFLTDVRSALITATALPVSVAGTFIAMSYLGFSINMMSLLALALAIGLLIDDAVVVREAIFSEMEAGKTAREAAVSGTDKVAAAVLATTLAVVAVFIPVSAMEGMVGQFFKEFGLTIVAAVLLSLWVAFTLDPMLSARFGGAKGHKPLQGRFWDGVRSGLTRLETWAGGIGAKAYARPWPVLAGGLVLLVVSGALILSRGADFLAFEDRGQLIVSLAAPAGSPVEATAKLADQAYARIQGLEGLTDVYATIGGDDQTRAEMRLEFVPKTKRKQGLVAIEKELNQRLQGLDGQVLVMEPPPVEGTGKEAPLAVYVYGQDFGPMYKEAQRVAGEIRNIKGVSGVRIETTMQAPGYDVTLDPTRLGYWGTSATAVEMTGRLALTGMEAGNVGADNLKLLVRYPQGERSARGLWDSTYVATPRGPVLLGDVAKAQPSQTPARIDREKRSRKIVLWGSLDRSRSYGLVLKDVESVLKTVPKPLSAEVAGDKELFDEMTRNFTIAIIGSAFFIFVILAIQFENLVRPFVILLTLPLAVIGAFLALYAAGQQLALGALIGIILLIGLAAKNGILLVDAVGHKEAELGLAGAVQASVRERFRPILMTSVAMIFGMLPTALMRGGGSEFRSPMAIAIIGGVVSSTLLSILVVPAVFGVIGRFGRTVRRRELVSRRRAAALAKAATIGLAAVVVAGPRAKAAGAAPAPAPAPATQVVQLGEAPADMSVVLRLINPKPREGSKEDYATRAADEQATGLTSASRQAFLGGVRASAERDFSSPGYTETFTLPLPPPVGPVTEGLTLVPKVQNQFQVAWQVPLFNLQTIRGLAVAARSREQSEAVTRFEKETTSRTKAQYLLNYELAQKLKQVRAEQVTVAKSRVDTVSSRVAAGLARKGQLTEAQASLAAAQADLAQAETEVERVRVAFEQYAGDKLPPAGIGLPSFPFVPERPFAPTAVKVLAGTAAIHDAAARAADAAFAPSFGVGVARDRKVYPGAPDAQTTVALQASWTLLDAGTRRRNVTDERRNQFQAESDAADTRLQMQTAYDTLKTRYDGARHALQARQAAYVAAEQAVADALASYSSGTGQLLDVRVADETRINAKLGVYQAEIQLQAIALESLVLSDSLLPFVENGGHI